MSLEFDESKIGLAARIFEYARRHAITNADGTLLIPPELLSETPTVRALTAADSYDASLRSTQARRFLEELVSRPDPKLGVFAQGFKDEGGSFRTYRVVGGDGRVAVRRAKYDGQRAYVYVPSTERKALERLDAERRADPRLAHVEVVPFTPEEFNDHERRLELRFDRPGMLWMSTRCPLLPEIEDDHYMVPGARFGSEAYYHDARINAPGARSTIEALVARGDPASRAEAERVLSAIRGTVNLFVNQINTIGKALNANLTVYAGRTQAPGLTTCIREVHAAWRLLFRGNEAEIKKADVWLAWATDAAIREYGHVWQKEPRLDPVTGLSRYVDETPSEAPEEQPGHYAGIEWSADDIRADAAIREHGWDSHVGALALVGRDAGRPRQHRLIPICLNSLLYKYEVDIADLLEKVGRGAESPAWRARADARKASVEQRMWNEERGLYTDLVMPDGPDDPGYRQNGFEDLRAFMPLWAGIVEPRSARARRLMARLPDFMRKGGLATATEASWFEARSLNREFTERCQWGHKDIGWPITTYETVVGLRNIHEHDRASEIAYRWCWMVQREMERSGGLQYSARGGYEAPVMEKMDVTTASRSGVAEVGYGNQGAGHEGEGGGFRWGYDAFKLLARSLPPHLQSALERDRDPDLLFSRQVQLARYRR